MDEAQQSAASQVESVKVPLFSAGRERTGEFELSGAVFGRQHPTHAERYAMAEEFVEACRLLWDSWDDDAFIADKQAGRFVRPGRTSS